MKHHVFEDWLFNQDPLSPQEQEALREHLSECESCRTLSAAWHNVEVKLKEAGGKPTTAGKRTSSEAGHGR